MNWDVVLSGRKLFNRQTVSSIVTQRSLDFFPSSSGHVASVTCVCNSSSTEVKDIYTCGCACVHVCIRTVCESVCWLVCMDWVNQWAPHPGIKILIPSSFSELFDRIIWLQPPVARSGMSATVQWLPVSFCLQVDRFIIFLPTLHQDYN